MAATCDVAPGAYFRELSAAGRRYAGLVRGGVFPERPAPPGERQADAGRPELMPAPGGSAAGDG